MSPSQRSVIAKLEYGLFLYGHAPKSILSIQLRNPSSPGSPSLHPNKQHSLESKYSLPRNETRPDGSEINCTINIHHHNGNSAIGSTNKSIRVTKLYY